MNKKYEKHLFVCSNSREDDRKSCGAALGMAMVKRLKEIAKEKGVDYPVRIQRAGCLDVCEHGPAMVVYPEGVFYGDLQFEDLEKIVEEHMLNNTPVNEKMIVFQ